MFTTSIFALAAASLSLAQTSTVTLYIPGADTQSLVASIAGTVSICHTDEALLLLTWTGRVPHDLRAAMRTEPN